jgi:hypothetical protein
MLRRHQRCFLGRLPTTGGCRRATVVSRAWFSAPNTSDTISFMESKIRMNLPTTKFLKGALKLLHVSGLANAPFSGKVSAIAARCLQFDIRYEELLDATAAKEDAASLDAALAGQDRENILADIRDADESERARANRCNGALQKLRQIRKASATMKKIGPGSSAQVVWATSAAAPRFQSTPLGVYVAQHATDAPTATAAAATGSRLPAFSASEHARLLHVLIDARMTTARRSLSRPRDRDELDREPQCPWDAHIAPLFNDEHFAPHTNTVLCDGITTTDVQGIDPCTCEHSREASTLSDKWAKLKSQN